MNPKIQQVYIAGLKATVLVRDPSRLNGELAKDTTVIQGDVTNLEDVRKVMNGQDGVVVALGTRNQLDATTVMSHGLRNILLAMKEFGVPRISVCLSSFLFWDPAKLPAQFSHIHSEHVNMIQQLEASDREWVACLPPHIAANEPDNKGNYKVIHNENAPRRIVSKHDLGHFLVHCLMTDEHLSKRCGICSPEPPKEEEQKA
ncbi:hypothetical protein QYM36_013522 [Artemia franciscana]|uniref:NAD(P)-binding domain-containing protein n=1 Tax=Artemia franciscana TaxID=6661 RepID=A0AA88HEH4_ARTSF|nr:hypothetical protein QYM36_013522 [Artemia franciscana]